MIYAIQEGTDGPVKIGRTTNSPHARMSELQTGNPTELRVIGELYSADPDDFIERVIHAMLAEHHMRGEWFEPAPLVLAVAHLMNEPDRGGIWILNMAVECSGVNLDDYKGEARLGALNDWAKGNVRSIRASRTAEASGNKALSDFQ